jgi:hypothetical protein
VVEAWERRGQLVEAWRRCRKMVEMVEVMVEIVDVVVGRLDGNASCRMN